jgi:hypothetical protein
MSAVVANSEWNAIGHFAEIPVTCLARRNPSKLLNPRIAQRWIHYRVAWKPKWDTKLRSGLTSISHKEEQAWSRTCAITHRQSREASVACKKVKWWRSVNARSKLRLEAQVAQSATQLLDCLVVAITEGQFSGGGLVFNFE